MPTFEGGIGEFLEFDHEVIGQKSNLKLLNIVLRLRKSHLQMDF